MWDCGSAELSWVQAAYITAISVCDMHTIGEYDE